MAKYMRLKTNRGYLRKRRRYYKRRKKRPSRVNAASNSVVVKNPTPLPQKLKTNLRYVDLDLDLDPGISGTAAGYVFSTNGLYDPDITGTGHQPTGFDQLMLMYDHYTVIGAKIIISATNTNTIPLYLFANVQDNSTLDTDLRVPMENGQCSYKLLGTTGSGGNTGTIVKKINPAKFLSRSKPLSDPDLKGTVTSNPVEQAYFCVYCAPISAQDVGAIKFSVTLEYTAIFHEPKQLALS